MKKLTLSIGLVAAMLSAKAQDTICVYFHGEEVYEYNYYTSEIVSETKQTEDFMEIIVDSNKVLCLHLGDQKNRVRNLNSLLNNGDIVFIQTKQDFNLWNKFQESMGLMGQLATLIAVLQSASN